MNEYVLLDSGNRQKLEQFGPYRLIRPCGQAVWTPQISTNLWNTADATFSRDERWHFLRAPLPEWAITIHDIRFRLQLTDFGHIGLFPEQISLWNTIYQLCAKRPLRVLNLFAYSGGSTFAAALQKASVCHVDASSGMVAWARQNASLNGLEKAPIRYIVEDVRKFLQREIRRGSTYDAIILDPPSFGRGSKGEVFKIEEEIVPLLFLCAQCLSQKPSFVLLSAHTAGFTPTTLSQLLQQMMKNAKGTIFSNEMLLQGTPAIFSIPSGAFALWSSL